MHYVTSKSPDSSDTRTVCTHLQVLLQRNTSGKAGKLGKLHCSIGLVHRAAMGGNARYPSRTLSVLAPPNKTLSPWEKGRHIVGGRNQENSLSCERQKHCVHKLLEVPYSWSKGRITEKTPPLRPRTTKTEAEPKQQSIVPTLCLSCRCEGTSCSHLLLQERLARRGVCSKLRASWTGSVISLWWSRHPGKFNTLTLTINAK